MKIVKIPKKALTFSAVRGREEINPNIILKRFRGHLERLINHEYSDFRFGFFCIIHISTVRINVEQSAEFRSPLCLLLIIIVNNEGGPALS